MLYIENSKDAIRKLLEVISEVGKGYKINTQKSVAFLYTKRSEREIKERIPFTITSKIKYQRINVRRQKICTPKTIRC